MKITVQKILNVPDPVRAHPADAGLDLYVPEGQGCLVRRGAVYTIDLGVRVAIPDGYYGQLTLRSSAGKKGLMIPHGVGVIDSGYRGNLKVLVTALTEPVVVAAMDRICQLIILPLPPVITEVGVVNDNTDRSTGGFGSTDAELPRRSDTLAAGQLAGDRREGTDDRTHLTVGGLMDELQAIASQYGADTPIAVATAADADYEQATAPVVRYTRREPVPDDWDLFHVDPRGEATAVIS